MGSTKGNIRYLVIELHEFDDVHNYDIVDGMFNSREEAKVRIREELDRMSELLQDTFSEVLYISSDGNAGMTDGGETFKYFIAEINLEDNVDLIDSNKDTDSHELRKVYDLVQGDYENWSLDGKGVKWVSYLHKGDTRKLLFGFGEGEESKTFVSRFTNDIEDDDQYVGPGVCFYSDTHIEFRQWEDEAGETVIYTLEKTK